VAVNGVTFKPQGVIVSLAVTVGDRRPNDHP
jgi:hypothetical protein